MERVETATFNPGVENRSFNPFYRYRQSDSQKSCYEKRFGSNEEVIDKIEAYFEANDKSFSKKAIEMLKKRWNVCITLEGDYVDERS